MPLPSGSRYVDVFRQRCWEVVEFKPLVDDPAVTSLSVRVRDE